MASEPSRLTLSPIDPNYAVERDGLITLLQRIELAATRIEASGERFRCGPELMRWITVIGCAPYLNLEPSRSGALDFCHIELIPPTHFPRYLGPTPPKRPPICPHCKGPAGEGPELLERYAAEGTTPPCQNCGTEVPIFMLNWPKRAGFARGGIHFWNIFEGEAIPSDALLEQLETATGIAWSYFYA